MTKISYGRVYLVRNLANGKLYVGRTVRPAAERPAQLARLDQRSVLHAAIRRYGLAAF